MTRRLSLLWIPIVFLPAAFAQAQQAGSVIVNCVKARDGKIGDLQRFLTETSAKLGKYYVDNGSINAYVIARAVAPAGRAAQCDFDLVTGFSGPPKQAPQLTDEVLNKAGVAMTVAQRNARRDELSYLVSTEYWRVHDAVGTLVKGGYARLNYFKTNPNSQAE